MQLHHSFNQSHNRILKLVLLHHSHTTASTSHSHTEAGATAPQPHHSFNQSQSYRNWCSCTTATPQLQPVTVIPKLVQLHHSHTTASTSHSHTETGAAAPQPPHCFNQSQSILKLVLLHHSVGDSACFTYPGIPLFWMSLLHCFLL